MSANPSSQDQLVWCKLSVWEQYQAVSDLTSILYLAVALLVIIDPIGALPLFLKITQNDPPAKRHGTAFIAALAVAIILLIALFTGQQLLNIMGISIDSLRVGGGLVILLLGLSMVNTMHSRQRATPEEEQEAIDAQSVAIVPIATPILAGPGAMSLVITHGSRSDSWLDLLVLSIIILFCAGCVYLLLRLSHQISKRLGTVGINIAIRLSGLLLMAIAVQMMAVGIMGLFPTLKPVEV